MINQTIQKIMNKKAPQTNFTSEKNAPSLITFNKSICPIKIMIINSNLMIKLWYKPTNLISPTEEYQKLTTQ